MLIIFELYQWLPVAPNGLENLISNDHKDFYSGCWDSQFSKAKKEDIIIKVAASISCDYSLEENPLK